MYPKVYHEACNYLVSYGAHGPHRQAGRDKIAKALRWAHKAHGRDRAARERSHMLFISGMFPEKPKAIAKAKGE